MERANCTLYSSGLKGAEATFGEEAEKNGINEVIYSFDSHKLSREKNVVVLSQEELERGDISMELASRMLHRTYYETDKIRKVLQTIFHMVNSGHQVFVIGSIQEDGSVKGGTGWAVELAKMFNRPLHVFDQPQKKWFTWRNEWQEDSPKIEYDTFVGSGTRYLNDAGREAISQLFADSFSEE
jgi:hypothetical protein